MASALSRPDRSAATPRSSTSRTSAHVSRRRGLGRWSTSSDLRGRNGCRNKAGFLLCADSRPRSPMSPCGTHRSSLRAVPPRVRRPQLVALLLGLTLAACGDGSTRNDAGLSSDDAGLPIKDAGLQIKDAGFTSRDAGHLTPDAGPLDAGAQNAEHPDAGQPDAGGALRPCRPASSPRRAMRPRPAPVRRAASGIPSRR